MKEIILLTGVSGAGKSTAMSFMEDIGYYCIDNMPAELIPVFIDLTEKSDAYSKIAIVADVRSSGVFDAFMESVKDLQKNDYLVKIIYLDVKNYTALKRYKLTRRKHPFADKFSGSIEEALQYEKKVLAPVLQNADFVIDTSEHNRADWMESMSNQTVYSLLFKRSKPSQRFNSAGFCSFKPRLPTCPGKKWIC